MLTFQLIEVILYVQDMARQVQFYRDVLGLPVTEPRGVTNFSGEFWVVLDADQFRLVLHGGGQGRLGADTPNLGFRVEDIHAARTHLLQRNVAVGEIRQPVPTSWVIDATDPEGNRLSFVQRS
jgi:predicted enzyme related to lactoylglutathione lyase